MHIQIDYESSWRNSFLDPNTSNNESLDKKGRKYTASITNLKNAENYITRSVTHDTIMGLLNRLIGDQRKLYQSRQDSNYFFSAIEKKISFEDKVSQQWQEMIYLRNISGSEDRNSFTGSIKSNDPIFNSDYSQEFWGILNLDMDELIDVVLNEKTVNKEIDLNPISIIEKLELIDKFKSIPPTPQLNKLADKYKQQFDENRYINTKGEYKAISLYCSALYIQLNLLEQKYDMSTAKTKSGRISGISKYGFTKKDFMVKYTTGDKKKIWGNPYIHETYIKGEGKQNHLLNKSRGSIHVNIDIDREQAKQLKHMIEHAAVSSFYLGKKGLAYVVDIDTRESSK